MTDVKRVWGKADELHLEFTYLGEEQWETTVPPDTSDGVYACELWAINGAGDLGHWTGELFMCSGVCCINIFSQPYQIWFKTKRRRVVIDKKTQVNLQSTCLDIAIDKGILIIFERGCACVQ